MSHRHRSLVGFALLVIAFTAVALPAHAYWLKVRRKGPSAIVEAARGALVGDAQWWRYELDVLDADPGAGLALEISRRPTKGGGSDVGVRVRDKRGVLLAALAVVGGKVTVWRRGGKASDRPKDLFTPVPELGIPLVLWAVFEMMPAYRVRLEGEFQGTALLRMTPDYTSVPGLQPMKLGVSKRNLLPTVTEVVDLKGTPTSRLLWVKPRLQGGRTVVGGLRVRTMASKKPLDFALITYKFGATAPTRFGKKALAAR